MWILIITLLMFPLILFIQLADNPVQVEQDYVMQGISPEMAQFSTYTTAVRQKMNLTMRSDNDYDRSWTDEELASFSPNPVIKFPTVEHGNCLSGNQDVTVHRINGNDVTKTCHYRIAWITPNSKDWHNYTKYFSENYYGVYKNGSVTTKGNWGNIMLCGNIPDNSFIFTIEQKP